MGFVESEPAIAHVRCDACSSAHPALSAIAFHDDRAFLRWTSVSLRAKKYRRRRMQTGRDTSSVSWSRYPRRGRGPRLLSGRGAR